MALKCALCGAPIGGWSAPGEKGVEQQWFRRFVVDGRGRARCADRSSCKSRASMLGPNQATPRREP